MTAITHAASPTTAAASRHAGVGSPPGAPPVRPVSADLGRNPLVAVRPCRRVIGTDGALRGYADCLGHNARPLGLEGALPA